MAKREQVSRLGVPMSAIVDIEDRPEIRKRRVRLGFTDLNEQYFYGGNPLISTLVAALSSLFPPGEREFVRSVTAYLDELPADSPLVEAIREFSGQEGQHAHQHRAANLMLDQLGYGATRCSAELEREIHENAPKRSKSQRLAMTAGAEHLTAILGNFVLSNPQFLEPLPTEMRQLLIWHAIEEIEHKAVAFDVHEACVGDRREMRLFFLIESVLFAQAVIATQWWMLREMKARPRLRDVTDTWRILWGRKGLVRSLRKPFMAFFRKDFHPWHNDDRALITQWKTTLEAMTGSTSNAA